MLDDVALEVLRGGVTGQVIVPSDGGYDSARRVWNGNVDRQPAVVVRCSGVADVQFALGFAGDDIITSLERRLADERRLRRRRSVDDLVDRFQRLPVLDYRSADEIIGYDENGLPA